MLIKIRYPNTGQHGQHFLCLTRGKSVTAECFEFISSSFQDKLCCWVNSISYCDDKSHVADKIMATFTRSHRSSSLDKHFQRVSRNTCITLSTNHGTACSPIFRMFFLSASSRTPWSGDGSVMPGNKSDTMPSNKGKSCDKNWKKNGKTR